MGKGVASTLAAKPRGSQAAITSESRSAPSRREPVPSAVDRSASQRWEADHKRVRTGGWIALCRYNLNGCAPP